MFKPVGISDNYWKGIQATDKIFHPHPFTPNWKRNGLKSKEEAMGHVIDCLFKNKKKILNASVSDEATFSYQGYTIKLKGKKKKK